MDKTYLVHHGIKGQKWGVRRFQNNDGTLTPRGRKKYNVNEDGTTQLKKSYVKGQRTRGVLKTAVGAALMTKGVSSLVGIKKNGINVSEKPGKKLLNSAVLSTLMGTIVIGSASKNFINTMRNKSFNTTGMGATPETFTGKPKTQAQVIAAQNKANKK